jgi:hypothetical protein
LEGLDAGLHAGADEPWVAVPLLAADGHACGVVSISKMEFEVFRLNGLKTVEVLVSGVVASVERNTWEAWFASTMSGERDPIDAAKRGSRARAWDAIT